MTNKRARQSTDWDRNNPGAVYFWQVINIVIGRGSLSFQRTLPHALKSVCAHAPGICTVRSDGTVMVRYMYMM